MNFKKLFTVALLLFGFCATPIGMAQSRKKKQEKPLSIDDIEKRKALLKAKEELNTLERGDLVAEDPCTLFDDDEWYTAFNQKAGGQGDPLLANTLLRLCQEQLKSKIKGRYQAVVRDYFDQMDMDGQSSETSHIESAGDYIIDRMLNDTRETCRKTSDPDDYTGNIIMYMSIRVSKKELVDKLATGIAQDKELKVRFNERAFRDAALLTFQKDDRSGTTNPMEE
jgi:hypothetical protein